MSESKINFKIVTSEKTVYEDVIDQATFMTTDGQITILPNHRSYITSLESGEAMVKIKGEEVFLSISGGFIEFHNNTLIVLADTAERAEEIDLARAEEARKRAEELKKEAISMDDEDYARVAAAIQKESARIRVAKKHYTKKGINIGQ
ncbi:MAG: ATP synthase F1 subunit epsilon [Candidatus Moraniibacteriota bacterium]